MWQGKCNSVVMSRRRKLMLQHGLGRQGGLRRVGVVGQRQQGPLGLCIKGLDIGAGLNGGLNTPPS